MLTLSRAVMIVWLESILRKSKQQTANAMIEAVLGALYLELCTWSFVLSALYLVLCSLVVVRPMITRENKVQSTKYKVQSAKYKVPTNHPDARSLLLRL